MTFDAIDQMAVSTIRSLSIEAIQAANSGHPGLPMGAAPMAYVLWNHVMNVNPKTSRNWTNRDRFVLSAGHGSALLYSLLHLSGYDVTMDEIGSAIHAAYAEAEKVKEDVRAKGEETLRYIDEHDMLGIVLAGRPYHLDPEINHGLPELINSYKIAVFTED